ncbi:UPF0488 protein C8orf33 homolog [Gastrophryne carolinensis]
MEEAPKGTFQDELDWCIQQLETGLLRRNPTQQQVSDTQRILRVLRSRKAPFVKKRQMMNQVFGNYRLKMAEERKQQEKAAQNSQAQIQEVTNPDSRSVAYRKCTKDGQSTSAHWFTPSDNSFTFNFCPDPTENCPKSGKAKDSPGKSRDLEDSGQVSALGTGESSGFSFNFHISDAALPQDCEEPKSPERSADQLSSNLTSLEVSNIAEAPAGSSQSMVSTAGLSDNQRPELEATGQNSSDTAKKKKKSQKKKQAAQTEKKVENNKAETDGSSSAIEEPQAAWQILCNWKVRLVCSPFTQLGKILPRTDNWVLFFKMNVLLVPQAGADDLQRELDWCVEQLEIGLQRQKSTPKQVDEAARAIKTLRGEKVALVKKRQVMRTMFGDYRRKMEEEKQKQLRLMQAAAKTARVSQVSVTARQKSSKVFRKSTHKSVRAAEQDLPAGSPDSPGQMAIPGTSSQCGFVFQSSQDPFCFNFF